MVRIESGAVCNLHDELAAASFGGDGVPLIWFPDKVGSFSNFPYFVISQQDCSFLAESNPAYMVVEFDERCDRCLATAHEPNFKRRDEVFGGGGNTQPGFIAKVILLGSLILR